MGSSLVFAGQLITNGDFSQGVYTSTITDNTQNPSTVTNNQVPVGWTPNYGFDSEPSFNHPEAITNPVPGGNPTALSISNYDYQPLATLSQTITDVNGATYIGSFWAFDGGANGDSNAFLSLAIDGTAKVTLDDTVASWTQYGFSFTGTGSNALTIAAQTNPSEWYVTDVSVTGQAVTAVPEPSMAFLLIPAFMGIVGIRRKLAK
jgi:hypothetical protein